MTNQAEKIRQNEATEPDATGQVDITARELAQVALDAAFEKKAIEPVLLNVNELCSYTEYILVISGRSDRQVDAIAEAVSVALKARGRRPLGIEGVKSGNWALLDFGDIVVHVFHHPARLRFDLESLWIDAPREDIEIPEEARAALEDSYE